MNATNGIGWEIQGWFKGTGWARVSGKPWATPGEARACLPAAQSAVPDVELRVYEALKSGKGSGR